MVCQMRRNSAWQARSGDLACASAAVKKSPDWCQEQSTRVFSHPCVCHNVGYGSPSMYTAWSRQRAGTWIIAALSCSVRSCRNVRLYTTSWTRLSEIAAALLPLFRDGSFATPGSFARNREAHVLSTFGRRASS